MSALEDALLHPANRPRALCEWLAAQVNPGADLRGLEDGGGAFCDFRPGFEERNPSLSANVGANGAVFKRFGGDGFEGGAVAFVVAVLNVSQGEAARLLIERAGIVDTPKSGNSSAIVRPAPRVGRALEKLAKLSPLEDGEAARRLKGWERLEADSTGPEAAELARRGLTAALGGLLSAYRFAGKVGKPGGPAKVYRLPSHILPGAVAFGVRGPDGKPWAVKVRNPGEKAELEAAKASRYAYIGKGQGTPAWCSPGELNAPAHVFTEGELNGAAVALALEVAGQGEAVGVQGVASAEALPHVAHVRAGAQVYLYADPDGSGHKARGVWARVLVSVGARVYQLPADLFGGGDACEALAGVGPEALGARVLEAMRGAVEWQPPAEARQDGDVWPSKREGYGVRDGKLCALRMLKDPETGEEFEGTEVLAEFMAHIAAEVTQEDGTGEAPRVFELEGRRPDGRPMRPARAVVSASDFMAMSWPVREWGAAAVVHPGQGKKDKARAAIQLLSGQRGVIERTVYQHTGWIQHPEHGPLYLTAGAVIGAAGGVVGVDVELSGRLSAYALPDPAREGPEDVRAAVRASLALLNLAPDAVGVPVLGAAYRAPLGRLDAAVWATGETGRNKTAFLALAQTHYGAGWNRTHLPDGWNSTANALESAAFRVKDALFLIDDFKPSGGPGDTAKAQAGVSRILQGVADGQGRGTLTADRKARAGLYPRGTVVSSSETLPRGHSNRARVVIVDVTRPLIGKDAAMSAAYYAAEDRAAAGVYALALAAYVQQLAASSEAVTVGSPAHRERVRRLAPRFEGAHGRTGNAAAELAYGWEVFLSFAVHCGAVSEGEAGELWARVVAALEETAQAQGEHLHSEDPVTRALAVLSGLLAQGRIYLEDLDGGAAPPPDMAASLGWQRNTFTTADGEEMESWRTRPGGQLVGYYSKAGGDEWGHFLPDPLHEALQRAVQGQGGAALPDAGTLWANLRDRYYPAGLMRCEVEQSGRIRAFQKVTVNGERVRLLTLRLPLSLPSYNVGTVGTLGTDGERSMSGTVFEPVPMTLFFSKGLGTVGTPEAPPPASSLAVPESEDAAAWPEEWEVPV